MKTKINVSWKNAAAPAEDPAEIEIYEDIGQDPWTGDGISSKGFKSMMDSIPRSKSLNIRINSRGGDVWEGMTICSLLNEWPKPLNFKIDGIAASVASWIPMVKGKAGSKVSMPKMAQMFIHDAWGVCMGNASDMEETAGQLDKTSDQIAAMYAAKNGKSVAAMRQMMRDSTLMTGQEAFNMGLVDELTDENPINNFTPKDLATMREKLVALNSLKPNDPANKPKDSIMKREQIIAILNKHKVAFENSATDEQLVELLNKIPVPAAPENKPEDPAITALRNEMAALKEGNNALKKERVTNEVQKLVDNDQIPAAMRDKAILRAMSDETYLEEIKALPAKPPGSAPVNKNAEIVGEDIRDIGRFISDNTFNFTDKFIGRNAGRVTAKNLGQEIHDRSIAARNLIHKHRNRLVEAFNTNTIDAGLQRQVILADFVRAFSQKILPLTAFAKTFNSVPLQGTDKIDVPYFPLQTAASTDWVAGTGYVAGNTTENTREITVNKRKYQALAFSSQELRRQPYQNWAQLAEINAEKLATDVNQDVLSVVTNANYGAAVVTVPAPAFNADNVADLATAATNANWPMAARSLVLGATYYGSLLKDPSYKSALAYGSADPIQKGRIAEAYGFSNIFCVPDSLIPVNGENLVGFINQLSAVLVATSPIMPAPATMAVMVSYDVMVDPTLGIALEYRLFGNAQLDNQTEVVECNYGYITGVAAALKRITSA